MAGDRKQEILEITAELMQTRTFSAFSFQDIADRLGISKAAIHSHYRTKEILGVALLDKYYDDLEQLHKDIDSSDGDVWTKFDVFILANKMSTVDDNKVCPVTVLQLENNVIPESLQKGVTRIYTKNNQWLARLLSRGVEEGQMSFQGSAEGQAALIIGALIGAFLNSRAEGSDIFDTIVEQLKNSMKPAK